MNISHHLFVRRLATAGFGLLFCFPVLAAQIWLDELDVSRMEAGWGTSRAGVSAEGTPLALGGKPCARGVGTHAVASMILDVQGAAQAFDAVVGVDDDMLRHAARTGRAKMSSVRFFVYADRRVAASSPVLHEGDEPYKLHADLAGAKRVELFVCDAKDGEQWDHADWGEAVFTVSDGTKLVPYDGVAEQYGILSPAQPEAPRINGPKVYGVRPGHEIIYRLPVSGLRPMSLTAENLPDGVRFEAKTGVLRGRVASAGTYAVRFTAKNAKGACSRELQLVVGERLALTPPMGWNSWNCFAGAVTAQNIRDTADVFDRSELANHGWSYVNIDDFWQNKVGKTDDETLKGPPRRPDGAISVNVRFGDMREVVDYIHAKGLRAGIYSSPGPATCGGCTGSWKHEWQDAKTFADWGFDYLKYDWCGYADVAASVVADDVLARYTLPYRLMGEALRAQDRDIVYSLCQYGMANVSTWGATAGGHSWRTTVDITDTWASVSGILDRQADLWPYARPGEWNDPDMLVVGRLGWGSLHPTRLKPNEQYTHVSMWCMLCSPLLIGCDLTQLDPFTLSLLTNDEVLEVNQDPLGAAAARVSVGDQSEVWAKPMSDGSLVFALFNRERFDAQEVAVDFAALGLEGEWRVRDVWRQRDLGLYAQRFAATILPHGTLLYRFFPAEASARLRPGLNDIRDNATYRSFEHVRPVDKPNRRAARAEDDCPFCPKTRRSRK